MGTTTDETTWQRFADAQPERKSVDPDDRVRIALFTERRKFDLVKVHGREYRIRYPVIGESFGTVGVVEDVQGDETLHTTDTKPLHSISSARASAVRWILEQ